MMRQLGVTTALPHDTVTQPQTMSPVEPQSEQCGSRKDGQIIAQISPYQKTISWIEYVQNKIVYIVFGPAQTSQDME